MRAAILYGKDDIRVERIPEPTIRKPTDAIVRNAASCVCGSDLWHYRGINPAPAKPTPFGHEYCGVVEAVGEPRPMPRWTSAGRSRCCFSRDHSLRRA